MMSSPAPAVKPTITVCEMKLTSAPSRATPMRELEQPDQQREREHQLT